MLLNLKDQAELVVAINADDIEKARFAATWASPTTPMYCV